LQKIWTSSESIQCDSVAAARPPEDTENTKAITDNIFQTNNEYVIFKKI